MSDPAFHYHLSCYVRSGATRPSPFEGWATFATIFTRRPDEHRFAVARQLVLVEEGGQVVNRLAPGWLCWDLYDQGLLDRGSRGAPLRAPIPIWTGPSEAALVMRALHHG